MTMAGRYAAGAAGLALVVSLVGCGAGSGKDKPSADGASGTPRTAAEALDRTVKRLGSVTSYQASVEISTVVAGARKHLFGEVASRPKDQAVQYDVPFTTKPGEDDPGSSKVLAGDKLYLKNLKLLELIDKPWIGIPLSGVKPTDSQIMGLVAQIRQPDPLLHARMFTASKDVHTVGREPMGGTTTTRYQGTFALSEALTRLDAAERATAQAVYAPFGATPYFEIWIDDQRLVRKIGLVSRRDAKRQLNATMTYSTFDTPVSITTPPPAEVEDITAGEKIPA